MKHCLTLNLTNQLTEKPKEVGVISKNLKDVKELTIREFADYIKDGYAFTPANFGGRNRTNSNWISQSVFALDFDSGVTPEFINRLLQDEYKIIPNVIYTSFSDSPEKRKFRVVIFIDKVIDCNDTRKLIQEGLMNITKEADKSCKDASRMFYPGKKFIQIADVENSYETIINAISASIVTNDNNKIRKLKSTDNIEKYDNAPIEHFNFDEAKDKVRIFKDFCDGRHLKQYQIFGLATNMVNIKGGAQFMKEKMYELNAEGLTHYKEDDFNTIKCATYYNYAPQTLDKFSDYEEDYELTNLIIACKYERGIINIINQETKISLEEAENKFKYEFDRVLNTESGIYLFKLPTGFGKTAAIETLNNVTVAFPTNNLKDEVLGRMKVEAITTPNLPNFSSEVKERLEFYYNSGLNKNAVAYISEIAKDKNDRFDEIDNGLAKKYLANLKECQKTDKTLLTTHQRAIHAETPHDTIIFDEDMFNSLVTINKISIEKDILPLTLNTNFDYRLEDGKKIECIGFALYNFVKNLDVACINNNKTFVFNYKHLVDYIIENKLNHNLLAFLDSAYIWRDEKNPDEIYFITKKELPKNKKIIIMSATAPVEMYRMLFGNDLEIIDIMNVEQVGTVIQNTKYSYSKMCLSKRHESLSEELDDIPVLTFMQFKQYFKNSVKEMHFGNCAGYDTLNGKDIAVVGTFHLANFAYFLYATLFGITLKGSDNMMDYQLIEWNGFEFKFNTFENPILRTIQLSLIESELVQAIGRNRTLRNNCTTYVYSNFPLKQTTKFTNKR